MIKPEYKNFVYKFGKDTNIFKFCLKQVTKTKKIQVHALKELLLSQTF